MLTKEKIISAIQAMPETEFEDIEVLLERIVELEKEEESIMEIKESKRVAYKKAENMIKDELQEPMAAYGISKMAISKNELDAFPSENDAEMMGHIEKKLNEATDPETIYLIKKIKHSLENVQAGNFYTIEQAEAKINSWFKK